MTKQGCFSCTCRANTYEYLKDWLKLGKTREPNFLKLAYLSVDSSKSMEASQLVNTPCITWSLKRLMDHVISPRFYILNDKVCGGWTFHDDKMLRKQQLYLCQLEIGQYSILFLSRLGSVLFAQKKLIVIKTFLKVFFFLLWALCGTYKPMKFI